MLFSFGVAIVLAFRVWRGTRPSFSRLAWRGSELFAFGVANSRLFAFGVPHETEFLGIPPHETQKGFGVPHETEFFGNRPHGTRFHGGTTLPQETQATYITANRIPRLESHRLRCPNLPS